MVRRIAWLALALAPACHGESARPGVAGNAHAVRLAQRELDERPALVLVARGGDPSGAVAFAATHDAGSRASAAVTALLTTRLAERGVPGVVAHPTALGFALGTLAAEPAAAGRFVTALVAALFDPLRPGEAGLGAARAALGALSQKEAPGAAEASVTACSGEPLPLGPVAPWDPATPAGMAELSSWVFAARSRATTAFGAVGSQALLSAVESALVKGQAWRETAPSTDAWPIRDELGVDFSATRARRLSVALRVTSSDLALAAADALGEKGALLGRRLAALRPPWLVDRTLGTARPRGACVRVDLTPPRGEPGPMASDVARALAVVNEELDRALAEPRRPALEEAVLTPTDPRQAAAAAAWSALARKSEGGPTRRAVAYTAGTSERSQFDLGAAVAAERDAARRPTLELRVRNEPGQARAIALVATPCGTGGESAADAGEAALVVNALARVAGDPDVVFAPFVTTDGVGLLAETRRRDPAESAAAQAERLGRALGERLAVDRPPPNDVARARDELVEALGRGPRRGYFAALDTLTRGHPSWLDPRGTLVALGSAPAGDFDAALARFLARPLRLAIVTNGADAEGAIVGRAVERLIRPVRGTVTRCPGRPPSMPDARELTLVAADDEQAASVLALPFAPFPGRLPKEARATVYLLNRPRGLLSGALAELSASASAAAVGGPHAAALVVEVVAEAGSERNAVERVKSLFDRLAKQGVTAAEVLDARRELERLDAAEHLDPRNRAVELFRGAEATAPLDAARLLEFMGTLARTGTVLVTVAPRGAP